MGYNWNWGVFLQPSATGDDTYLGWMLYGLKMTVALSLSAWIMALVLGAVIGVLRTVPNKALSGFAMSYVELFRNCLLYTSGCALAGSDAPATDFAGSAGHFRAPVRTQCATRAAGFWPPDQGIALAGAKIWA